MALEALNMMYVTYMSLDNVPLEEPSPLPVVPVPVMQRRRDENLAERKRVFNTDASPLGQLLMDYINK